MKKFFVAAAALGAMALTGCTTVEEAAPVTTTTTVATTTTPTATVEPTPTSTESPTPIEPETYAEPEPVYVEPTAVEPYVVECGTGTPGPALMSDGTMQHSDYCFEVMGGAAYLAEESWANSPDNPALAEQNHRSPSSGEMQMQMECALGNVTDADICASVEWVAAYR